MKRIGEWVKYWAEKSNIQLEYFYETTSTNDIAKKYSYTNLDPIVFITESQTHGRGRGKNTWTNPEPGSSLLCSFSFGVESAPQPITTALVGLAVYRALSLSFEPHGLNMKAPNDIFIGSKKIGGLLVEVLSEGNSYRLIIGIGLNILASPKIDVAEKLDGKTKTPITQDSFCAFLNTLFVELTQVLADSTQPELSPATQQELLLALNAHPLLAEKYTAVEPDGSLRTLKKVIDWMSL